MGEGRDARRGEDSRQADVDADGLEPFRQGGLDLRPRGPRVPADDDAAPAGGALQRLAGQVTEGPGDPGFEPAGAPAEEGAGRAGHLGDLVRGEEAVAGAIANPVRPEDLTHGER